MTIYLRDLPIEQKIGQLFCVGIAGPELDDQTRALLDDISPGGICLFSRNIRDAEQTRKLNDDITEYLEFKPFLSLDQEGGTVDRLRRLVTPMAAAAKVRTSDQASKMASIIGELISILGFNMDFAPVVDVVDNERLVSSNGLFSRPFGSSKHDVVELAGTFLRVLQEHGPIGCLKHFPGLGGARVDAHEELPVVPISREELFDTDLYPYRKLFKTGNVHAVMAAHVCFPSVDLQETDRDGRLLPSSLSYNFLTNLLRDELEYDGLVITDDLEMGAIVKNYGIGEACKMAVKAGVDQSAICADPIAIREGFSAVLYAVKNGDISLDRLDRSLVRIEHLKNKLASSIPFDAGRISQLSAEIAAFNEELGA